MAHVQMDRILGYVFDGLALSDAEQAHVIDCSDCLAQLRGAELLAGELAVARQSSVSVEARARYQALFAAVDQQASSTLDRLGEWLRAVLTWDSRQQPLAAGVRSAGSSNFRLLYAAGEWEVEMLVEPVNGGRRVVGEIAGADALDGPALVEIAALDATGPELAIVTDEDGRFRVERLAPGRYRMALTLSQGPILELPDLDLA